MVEGKFDTGGKGVVFDDDVVLLYFFLKFIGLNSCKWIFRNPIDYNKL